MTTFTASSTRLPGLVLKFLLTLALHGALLYWVLQAMPGLTVLTHSAPLPIQVAMILPPRAVVAAPVPPPVATPRPQADAAPVKHPTVPAPPAPPAATLLTADSGTAVMTSAPVAATPVAVQPVATAAAVSSVLEPARFDADYLNNPAPAYPLLSRRTGESGKVLLLVTVTVHGTAEQVEIKQGSGFPRLDQAALNAVRQWRFVPARRGDTAVAASVMVPITFRLDG